MFIYWGLSFIKWLQTIITVSADKLIFYYKYNAYPKHTITFAGFISDITLDILA